MADIRFYDFDLNLVHILPPNSKNVGYKSINTQQDYNGSGSLEIVFRDMELKKLVESYKANLIVTWKGFQGFLTSYRWNDKECRITGMHLNGLLNRAVIPALSEITGTVQGITAGALKHISWLNMSEEVSNTIQVTYSTDKPVKADQYLQNLFAEGNCGYVIKADVINKKFILEFIIPKDNMLIMSEENLNVYDVEISYVNKQMAYGGYYKNGDVWEYVTTDAALSGINKIDMVLSAETKAEALRELRQCKADYEITANVKSIEYGVDYSIGDIISTYADGVLEKKLVNGVARWSEGGDGEKPILTDYEEG